MINTNAKPKSTSRVASVLSLSTLFFLWFVPASQCGMRSAIKWDKKARGKPMYGFAILTARDAPIKACAVAVIYIELAS